MKDKRRENTRGDLSEENRKWLELLRDKKMQESDWVVEGGGVSGGTMDARAQALSTLPSEDKQWCREENLLEMAAGNI